MQLLVLVLVKLQKNFIDEDGWTIRTLDGKKSAHWEHTIGITEEGTRVFTENLF